MERPPRSLRSLPPEGALRGLGRPGATEMKADSGFLTWGRRLALAGVLAAAPLQAAEPSSGRYAGVLPCADCAGIETRLDLDADGSFSLRESYRGRSAAPFDDSGRWAMSSDGRTLVLRAGSDLPRYFAVTDDATLEKLDLEGQPIASSLDYRLRRDDALAPLLPRVASAGVFQYMADAASFTECRSGRRLPVAMAEAYGALEKAYVAARRTPGEGLMIQLRGRVELQHSGDDGPRPSLVVESFDGFGSENACPVVEVNAPFVATRWRLARLGDTPVALTETPNQPHLVFDARGRVIGATGCNRLVARYERKDAGLRIESAISTRMACAQGMEIEQQMLAALDGVRNWRLAGAVLELGDESGRLLGRFVAEAVE